jgi:amidophosphoribosyltransferase
VNDDLDHPKEECGVFGVFAPGRDVSRIAFFALHAMQHRGQESAGIAVADEGRVIVQRDLGLVANVFDESSLRTLTGSMAIGHVRYSTTGANKWDNAQPVTRTGPRGIVALGHNGNLTNTGYLRAALAAEGVAMNATTDSELIAAAVAQGPGTLLEAVAAAMPRLAGAFSVVAMTAQELVAFRDPFGVRPLVIGSLPDAGWCIASETCAFDQIGAQLEREVAPGEAVRITGDGIESIQAMPSRGPKLCVFESIYFARPDSIISGQAVWDARRSMGTVLAEESPADADLVVGLPDSGTPAAVGFANASGIPYAEAVVRNRYVGRSFIQPEQHLRQNGVRMKFNPLRSVIGGKRLVVVDDSIVRGTTMRQIVTLLEEAGAREVHLRISSPPVAWPCFYGIDMATRDELIAASSTVDEIRQAVGATSLAYLSLDGLERAIGQPSSSQCRACFTGEYPIPVPGEALKLRFEIEADAATRDAQSRTTEAARASV